MITKPSEIYFKDGVWAWDAANSTWVKLEVDASGYLKIVVAGTAGLTAAELNLDGAKDLQVDVKTSALPTGAATSAKQNQLQGWDGAAWRKLPLVWGYSDRYAELESANNVAAGDVTQTFTVVPAGEVWVVTSFSAYAHQANVSRVYLSVVTAAGDLRVRALSSVVAFESIVADCPLVLVEDDYLKVFWAAASLNDDFRACAVGYKMKIAE